MIDSRPWERWGDLRERYEDPRPRRILALDGGGIRGVFTLAVLEHMERELRAARGESDLRLCEFFDLIGGTSTGAIIAAGLAQGMSVADITRFYHEFGEQAFSRSKWRKLLRSLYQQGPLERQLQKTFGVSADLRPNGLQCLLTVVMRNASTDSAWPISSNPFARYNDPARSNCNLRIPLWQLVRASTAAPAYFPPEVIALDPEDPRNDYVFVDGGTSSYNNPAFLLFRMATLPQYALGWESGERNLLIVSVGTGGAPVSGPTAEDPDSNLLAAAYNTLVALMSQAAVDQDVNCRTVGRCTFGDVIDRELGDLIPRDPASPTDPLPIDQDSGKAFLYARYDVDLTDVGLAALGFAPGELDPRRLRKLDAVDQIEDLAKVGRRVAERFDLAQFGSHA